VGVNGSAVTSLDDFHTAVMALPSGTVVTLKTLAEDGTESIRQVYLAERPKNPGYAVYRHNLLCDALLPLVGMRLTPASSSDKRKYVVELVLKGSVSEEAGFSETDPVEILDVKFDDEHTAVYVTVHAKKRKNGYLGVSMIMPSLLDSANYF
jgi:hypothetical protein